MTTLDMPDTARAQTPPALRDATSPPGAERCSGGGEALDEALCRFAAAYAQPSEPDQAAVAGAAEAGRTAAAEQA